MSPLSLVLRPESLVLRPESLVLRPESLVLRPESLVFRPESLVFRPECLVRRPQSFVSGARSVLVVVLVHLVAAGCSTNRPEGAAIGVGTTNSVIDLDPRSGTDEASQKAHHISLWYKTNIAVVQPDIHGVRLSPIADFMFLTAV
jgi:hypothetical protein